MKEQYGASVTVERIDTQALVRFDRGVNRNAINQDTLLALTEVANDLSPRLDIHSVVLTGAPDIFSAGIDLKDPAKWQEQESDLLLRRDMAKRGSKLCQLWEDLPQLTIAAIEGAAVGGSVGLALACDWRVASGSAFFYLPEAKVGLNMGWGAVPRMVNILGASRAKQAILLAPKLPAIQAQDWGLVDFLCDNGQAVTHALEISEQVLQVSPAILRMTKESVNFYANTFNRLAAFMDADQALVCRDSTEGVSARNKFLRS